MKGHVGAFVLIVGLATTLTAARAQPVAQQRVDNSQRPIFRSDANLVQVDVVVLDKSGHPVTDLTRDDFELSDRGRPQTIATFSAISHERHPDPVIPRDTPLDVADNGDAATDRLVVLVLDDHRTSRRMTEDVRQLARRIIEEIGGSASMALVTTSGRLGVEVTEDRSRLFAAFDKFEAEETRFTGRGKTNVCGIGCAGLEGPDPGMSLKTFFDDDEIFSTIRNVAKALSPEDGRRKALVWISSGLPFSLKYQPGSSRTGEYGGGPSRPDDYYSMSAQKLLGTLRSANVVVYAVDPAGAKRLGEEGFAEPTDSGDLVADLDVAGVRQRSLKYIAKESGGFALTNTNDFRGGLLRLVNDLDHYYMLGFYPDDVKTRGYHSLTVHVKRPDLIVRHRGGYRVDDLYDARRYSSSAALVSGVLPKTDLRLRLHALPVPGSAGVSRVLLTLEVTSPAEPLADAAGRLTDTLKYSVVAVDLDKKKATATMSREGRIELNPHTGGVPPLQASYQILTSLQLRPGRYQLRVAATSQRLGVAGSVYLLLDVPEFAKLPLVLSGPLLTSRLTAAVPAAVAESAHDHRPFQATLDREFSSNDELRLYCLVLRKVHAPAHATISIEDDGNVLWSDTLTLDAQHDTLDVQVPLRSIAPGGYTVRIIAQSGTMTAERKVPLTIISPHTSSGVRDSLTR